MWKKPAKEALTVFDTIINETQCKKNKILKNKIKFKY
jgi:hypothetical protein